MGKRRGKSAFADLYIALYHLCHLHGRKEARLYDVVEEASNLMQSRYDITIKRYFSRGIRRQRIEF